MNIYILQHWCEANDCHAVIDGDNFIAEIRWNVNDEFLLWVDLDKGVGNA